MKIARFRTGRRVAYGVVKGEEVIEIRGSIYTRFRMTDTKHRLEDIKLLAPTEPTEMWGPGLNFADHLAYAASLFENGDKAPPMPGHPEPWVKARGSLTGHEDPIILPKDSQGEGHYEERRWRLLASSAAALGLRKPAVLFWVTPAAMT